jgi:hypothetical protein
MCEKCSVINIPVSKQSSVYAKRKKIWELETGFHCSVVGTCLSLAELRHLCKKMKISMQSQFADYDWHHSFVRVAGSDSFAARTLNKHLDKKYKETIKQTLKLNTEELSGFWAESVEKDKLSDTFWAILTHPDVEDRLLDQIYGEVHMLSHLSGASLRVDMEKLKRLEKDNKSLTIAMHSDDAKTRNKITEQSKRINLLKRKSEKADVVVNQLAEANKKIEKLNSNSLLKTLKEKLFETESKLDTNLNRVHYLEVSVDEWKKSALNCGDQLGLAETQLQELRKENNAMEQTLKNYLNQSCSSCDNQDACVSNGNLAGSCVLYVGGRDKQCAHFRTLVEDINGTFIHHDGGLNDGSQHLNSLLPKADMVFCPIDCISHNAVHRVRQFCNRTGKPLVILRRASLAAFTRGLNEVTS